MNVILVSGRYPSLPAASASASASARHETDAAFAAALAAAGCEVRWIVPTTADLDGAPVGVTMIPARTIAPGFKAVEARLLDHATEACVAREIRRELPTVVHLLDYGGSVSVNLSWLASRLGVPVVVSASAAATLCHRGSFVYADGSACAEWSDPRRCAACCITPSPGGLSTASSWLGRLLITLHWPVHAYGTATTFENRRELVAGGLRYAVAVVVSSPRDRDLLASLGVRADQLQLCRAPGVEDWRAVYAGAAGT